MHFWYTNHSKIDLENFKKSENKTFGPLPAPNVLFSDFNLENRLPIFLIFENQKNRWKSGNKSFPCPAFEERLRSIAENEFMQNELITALPLILRY